MRVSTRSGVIIAVGISVVKSYLAPLGQRSDLVRKRKGLGVFVAEDGDTAAQKKTETAMYGRFTDGIKLGRATSLGVQRIRSVFGKAMNDVKDAATGNVDAPSQGDS